MYKCTSCRIKIENPSSYSGNLLREINEIQKIKLAESIKHVIMKTQELTAEATHKVFLNIIKTLPGIGLCHFPDEEATLGLIKEECMHA